MRRMANKEISVSIRARDYATAVFEKVRATVNSVRDRTVNVRANTGAAQAAVQGVRDKLAEIRDKVVRVKVDTGGVEANVGGVSNSLAEFATKAGLAALAMTALQSTLSAGKSAFIEYNAQLEQTRVAFTSMLGSATQANAMIANLQKFAAETPFEMPGVRDAAQQLLAFGYDTEEIIPTLTALGNAASGLGRGQDGFNHLAFVFGQIRTTGKLMGQDVMQLAQLGVPVKDILAKNLGLTKDELANIGEVGIDADVAIKALIDGMNERFPEMMKKQSETFEGVLSNIKDNIGQAFGLAGMPLFEEAKQALLEIKNITDTMLSNAQGGKSIFAGILPDDLLQKAETFVKNLKKSFEGLAPVVEPFLGALAKVADVLLDVGSIALASLRPIIPVITLIGQAFFALVGIIADVTDVFLENFLTIKTNAADSFDETHAVIADMWQSAKETVTDFCTATIEFIAGLVVEIDEVVSPVVDTFASAFHAAADFVRTAMERAIGYVRAFIAWVDEAIASVKELAFVKAASNVIGGVSAWLGGVSDATDDVRQKGRASLAGLGFYGGNIGGDGLDGDIAVPQRTEVKPPRAHAPSWGGTGGGTAGGTRSAADPAAREAQKLAEKIERLTAKIRQSVTSLAHDIVGEVGTTYEKGMEALRQKTEQMEAQIAEASAFGIDTDALRAKLDEYANIVKEKVTKAWREANEDLQNETVLTWAQVTKDARAEAEATYQIGVTKLAREKENRLKEVAMTKDSAEARVAVEQWAAAEMARLDQQRVDALREVNKKRLQDMQERGDVMGVKNYLAAHGKEQQTDIDLAGQQELARAYVNIWNDAHASVYEGVASAMQMMNSSMAKSFEDVIMGTKSAKEAVADFGKSVISMIVQIAAQKMAANIVGGIFGNAFGGIFGGAGMAGGTAAPSARAGMVGWGKSLPGIQPFADGGIVTAPTLGLIGEKGYREAVIPLTRGHMEKLGIGQPRETARPIQVIVQTPDAGSFRRSEAQIAASVRRAVNAGQRFS